MRHRHGLHRLRRTLRVPAISASAIALTAAVVPTVATAVAATFFSTSALAATLATAVAAAALASANVVQRYLRIFQQRRLPGRRLGLAHCFVWRCGSVRHRHGLHRLRRTLQVPAVFAAAVAVAATALNAPPTNEVRRDVCLFQQRRVPGRWVWLAYGHVWHASAVRHRH